MAKLGVFKKDGKKLNMQEQENEVTVLNPIACPKRALGGNIAVVKKGKKVFVQWGGS
jgi:hypothetical protein